MSKKNPKPAPVLHLAAKRSLVYWADENGECAGDHFPSVAFFCDEADAAEYVTMKKRIEGALAEIAEWRKTLALACIRQPDDPHARARSHAGSNCDSHHIHVIVVVDAI